MVLDEEPIIFCKAKDFSDENDTMILQRNDFPAVLEVFLKEELLTIKYRIGEIPDPVSQANHLA